MPVHTFPEFLGQVSASASRDHPSSISPLEQQFYTTSSSAVEAADDGIQIYKAVMKLEPFDGEALTMWNGYASVFNSVWESRLEYSHKLFFSFHRMDDVAAVVGTQNHAG